MRQSAPEIPGFERKTANVAGTDISYWIGGPAQGAPVLLWHGFLGTSFSWHKVMPLLAAAGCSVLVPDMRGFGDSAKPAGVDGYDGHALAEEFRMLVRQLHFGSGQPLTIAAHDMGAPPALLWAAHHPAEIAGLLYLEAPVMLEKVLAKIISYTPETMKNGSLWWWILPLAPGVPERLIVGHERAFLTWFYEGATADPAAIEPSAVEEYLRTFSGTEGVLGALGVYRAAFTTIDQTTPLIHKKVRVPVIALGGAKGLGAKVKQMVEFVAENVAGGVIASKGHFLPEEAPQELVRYILDTGRKGERRMRPFPCRFALQAGLSLAAVLMVRQLRSARKSGQQASQSAIHPKRRKIMNSSTGITGRPGVEIPPDDLQRQLTLAQPDQDGSLPHVGVVGDTYTILLSGDDTNGRFCLIDMHIPPGGGPPPHRHDFEETFIILEGELEATFRGKKSVVRAGDTVNIPSNAPHQFHNSSSKPVRLLCLCSPAGQENFFQQIGIPLETRTTPPPKLDKDAQEKLQAKTKELAPKYRTELLQSA